MRKDVALSRKAGKIDLTKRKVANAADWSIVWRRRILLPT